MHVINSAGEDNLLPQTAEAISKLESGDRAAERWLPWGWESVYFSSIYCKAVQSTCVLAALAPNCILT